MYSEWRADCVTADMRRAAKVINFGIIYGMSAFGLSKQLGVNQREAQKYIDNYFERHKAVKDFMDGVKESCPVVRVYKNASRQDTVHTRT